MTEWKEYKLKDITSLITKGTTPSMIGANFTTNGIKFIKSECILENSRLLDSSKYTFISMETHERLKRSQIIENDILFSMAGMFLGKTGIATKDDVPANTNQAVAIIRIIPEKADFKYVYYFLNQKALITYINGISGQSAQPNINLQQIGDLNIKLPPLPTQQKIAAILSSFDDKIELNNRINDNLEQQAQAIFKSWFVDFEPFGGKMPDGWRVGKLSEIAEITMGQSPDGKSYNENGIGTVFYQGRAEFGKRFPTRRLFTTEPKRIAKKFDTLMSVRAPVGDLNIANEDCCIGRGLAAIHSKDNHQSFVHYTVLALRSQLDVFNGEGTVFGCINRDALNNMEIVIPTIEYLDKFEKVVAFLDAEMYNINEENIVLSNIRDSLLPRLMSGEVEV
ncbi:MAG: restriction endonuclease subunit S [Spirochaetales bacterium]|nr:restriction endonuclease subunit S [Spirochaetales bacterium]